MALGPLHMSPTPYPIPGPSTIPFYPAYPTNPPTRVQGYESPSDNGQSIEYPAISDFLAELASTDHGYHHFENYTDYFHKQGYYHLDELVDESLTPEHMMEIIPGMRDGTARAIKSKVLAKVRQIKGRGKAK